MPIPAVRKLSRRSALGLLGVTPLAAMGTVAAAKTVASALLPGGAYDKFVSGLADNDQFSGTVLLAWHGEPVLVRSYQQANKERGIPNETGTSFYLASLTKFFTGFAVAQLAAQGKLGLDATLGSLLDGFPAAVADVVTVHQLLTHTSGIPDFTMNPSWRKQQASWITRMEASNGTLSVLQQLPLTFTPGTRYSYSNSNYFLAGAIVAQVSGQDFWNYVPQHIFVPAGMTSTGFFSAEQWLSDPGIAHNYGARQADGQRQDVTSLVATGPNGWDGATGIFSSASDLLRFARALQDGTLLSPAWTEVMTSGKHPIGPAEHNIDEAPGPTLIGYGSEERVTGGQRVYGHTGALGVAVPGSTQPGGGSTSLSIYPDLKVVAIVLSNYFLYPGIGGFLAEQDRIITQNPS